MRLLGSLSFQSSQPQDSCAMQTCSRPILPTLLALQQPLQSSLRAGVLTAPPTRMICFQVPAPRSSLQKQDRSERSQTGSSCSSPLLEYRAKPSNSPKLLKISSAKLSHLNLKQILNLQTYSGV